MRTLEAIAEDIREKLEDMPVSLVPTEVEALLLRAFHEAQAEAYAWDPRPLILDGQAPRYTIQTEHLKGLVFTGPVPSPGDIVHIHGVPHFVLEHAP